MVPHYATRLAAAVYKCTAVPDSVIVSQCKFYK